MSPPLPQRPRTMVPHLNLTTHGTPAAVVPPMVPNWTLPATPCVPQCCTYTSAAAVPTAAASAPTHTQTHVCMPSCTHRQLATPQATSTTCTPTGFHSTIHSPTIPQGHPHALARAADTNHNLHANSLTCRRQIGEGREERGAEGAEGHEEDAAPTHRLWHPQQHHFIAGTYLHLLAISCPNDGTSLLTHSVPYP
ncbi:hypothetical protein K439DRAFT_1627629 [Ramaria rubella]|nr:hypothetical protein K439DRAFT_1627629 [Ramaria rubella]